MPALWSHCKAYLAFHWSRCKLYGLTVRPCVALDVACTLSETKLFCSFGVQCPVLSLSDGSFFFSPKFLTCIQLFATPWTSSDQNAGMGSLSLLGIKPRSPALQADSLLAEPQGKPKNTGVGNLSLLQQIFPTQESNRGLLRCRRILYQLSHQGVVTVIWVISIAQISGFCLMFCPFVLSTTERDEFQEYLL